jgi:hypothetical protein
MAHPATTNQASGPTSYAEYLISFYDGAGNTDHKLLEFLRVGHYDPDLPADARTTDICILDSDGQNFSRQDFAAVPTETAAEPFMDALKCTGPHTRTRLLLINCPGPVGFEPSPSWGDWLTLQTKALHLFPTLEHV